MAEDKQRTTGLKHVTGMSVKVICSVTMEVAYGGSKVEIVALVSRDLRTEVILSC